MKTPRTLRPPSRAVLALAALLAAPALSRAADITWLDSAAGGVWATGSNWDGGTAPGVGSATDVALLGNATADRIILWNSATAGANNTIGGLQFDQTSAFLNQLEIRRAMVVGGPVTLGATGGGSNILRIDTRAESTGDYTGHYATATNVFTSSLVTVNTGGSLVFARVQNNTQTTLPTYVNGSVAINGGSLVIEKGVRTAGSISNFVYRITGDLTLSSGAINIATTPAAGGTVVDDTRLRVDGNFTATGGTIGTGGSTASALTLYGATNSIAADVLSGTVGIDLSATGAQSLAGGGSLSTLTLRDGTKTVSAAGIPDGNVASIRFVRGSTGTTTLRLASDLKLKSGTSVSAPDLGAGTPTFVINTDGYTLDTTLGTLNLGNPGSRNATWTINGGGTVKATTFNLSVANGGTNVGANTRLVATGDGAAINLGNASGTIDATSRFAYDGGTGSSATLQSNRDIGALEVASGTLGIDGANDFAAQGGIAVAAGAALSLGSRSVATDSWTIGLAGGSFGSVSSAAALSLAGDALVFDLGSGVADGNYGIFSAVLSGDLASVSVSGSYAASLTRDDNLWTGADGLASFSFDQSTGIFSVTAVPEPSAAALLAGAGVFGLVAARRRRRE